MNIDYGILEIYVINLNSKALTEVNYGSLSTYFKYRPPRF
jgi:hypothetical protein